MTSAPSPGSQLSDLLDSLEHTYGIPSSSSRVSGEPENSTAASLYPNSEFGTADPLHSFADVHLVQPPLTLEDATFLTEPPRGSSVRRKALMLSKIFVTEAGAWYIFTLLRRSLCTLVSTTRW
jgi:hypothetical protein